MMKKSCLFLLLTFRSRHTLIVSLFFTMSFALMEQTIGLFIERAWLSNILDAKTRHSEAAALTAYFLVAVGIGASIGCDSGCSSRDNAQEWNLHCSVDVDRVALR